MHGFNTPQECLERAGEAIKIGYDKGLLKGHLCFFEGTFELRAPTHTTARHTIFARLTHDQIRNGLSTDEWNRLNARLWNFFKEKI